MNATTCPVLSALRSAATAIIARDCGAMVEAYCELECLSERPDLDAERDRMRRMMRGLERRCPE